MKKIVLTLLFISCFSFFVINFSSAQSFFDSNTGLPTGIEEQLSVKIIPEVPSPGDSVSISVVSYSTNLNAAYFVWKTNGTTELEGFGEKNFNLVAPESGRSSTVSLTIQKEGGGVLTRSFTFSPADVDLIYEADTYTPPFYKGKALFTSESNFRVVAMPTFIQGNTKINPKNLIYKWSIGNTVDQQGSGYGKNVLYLKGSIVERPFTVKVEVSAPNSTLKAKGEIYMTAKEPEVLIYEDNPLLGIIFEKAVEGNFVLDKSEMVFQAIPFYFSSLQKENEALSYNWKMNGESLAIGSQSSSIRFRNSNQSTGVSRISLDVEHLQNILQFAQTSFNLNFLNSTNQTTNTFEF